MNYTKDILPTKSESAPSCLAKNSCSTLINIQPYYNQLCYSEIYVTVGESLPCATELWYFIDVIKPEAWDLPGFCKVTDGLSE